MARKVCIWVYRFVLFDGELVFYYHLRARNAKCANAEMLKVIDRDFPDFDILYQSRVCSLARFNGKLDFPEFLDTIGDMWKDVFYELYNELYNEVEDGQTLQCTH